jgi:hypothetical protein
MSRFQDRCLLCCLFHVKVSMCSMVEQSNGSLAPSPILFSRQKDAIHEYAALHHSMYGHHPQSCSNLIFIFSATVRV